MLNLFIKRFKEYKTLADKTFAQVNDVEMHRQPDTESNSIAIIIQHMHGNMVSRWTNFLSEDGEKPWSHRDDEFEVHNFTKQDLIDKWEEGWKVFLDTLESLKEEDLNKTITIRSQPLSVIDAIIRQTAHYSYHVGQIVYLGKWIRSNDWKSLSIPRNKSEDFNKSMKH